MTQKIIFLIIISIISIDCFPQCGGSEMLNKKYESYFKKNPQYAYVYMFITKKGESQKFYQYFFCDSVFVLAMEDKNNKIYKDSIFKKDVLFDYLDENWQYIDLLYKNFKVVYDIAKFRKDFESKKEVVTQIGIRYNDLHCNHFLPKSSIETESIANEDYRNGQKMINTIAAFFDKIFINQAPFSLNTKE